MDLLEKEGQDAFLEGFDVIERAAGAVLLQRKEVSNEDNS